jgi:hypothetical protein
MLKSSLSMVIDSLGQTPLQLTRSPLATLTERPGRASTQRPSCTATSSLMNVCVDPVSTRATSGVPPMVICSFIVSPMSMLVRAWSDMPNSSTASSFATSSSSSSKNTPLTGHLWSPVYFSGQ